MSWQTLKWRLRDLCYCFYCLFSVFFCTKLWIDSPKILLWCYGLYLQNRQLGVLNFLWWYTKIKINIKEEHLNFHIIMNTNQMLVENHVNANSWRCEKYSCLINNLVKIVIDETWKNTKNIYTETFNNIVIIFISSFYLVPLLCAQKISVYVCTCKLSDSQLPTYVELSQNLTGSSDSLTNPQWFISSLFSPAQ